MNEGAQPTRRALCRYAEYLVEEEGPARATKLIKQTRLNHVTRKIISLMKVVEGSSWRGDFHAGDLFAILNTRQYPSLVVRSWKRMCSQGLDGDSDAWAEAGRAMVNRSQYRMARDLFRDWRNRRGVRMWSLANYMQSLPRLRRRDLEEVIATCRDALADLPHDHCARYLAHMQAEAYALVGDKEGPLAVWGDRRGYFGSELKKNEYFKKGEKHLIHVIPDLVDALQRQDTKGYRKLIWRVRFQRLLKQNSGFPRLWNQNSRAILRLVVRIIIVLWVIAMAGGIFRK